MVKIRLLIISILLLSWCSNVYCEIVDPQDPFGIKIQADEDEKIDESKTSEQLIAEAEFLLEDERFLGARTKLLRALKKDPKAYRAHMLLAGYYMVHVGHFRLSLKYVKQAQNLFFEKEGPPPYSSQKNQLTHAQLLYLLSQARLNLDDYEGSLNVLDEFTKYNYFAAWYPGTRAWVLMKLGAVDEAIRVARVGILAGAEPGRTLNMLGILLSMHGDRDESLRIFREAIAFELSQGRLGQPATPLNNTGEVYKEIFEEERAESSWLKATSMPDGCEHVLPSLSLALLYIDQLNLSGAKRTIDNFESCVAQYPLRNGEEHRALVNFARGRIAIHAGNIDEAVSLIKKAIENRQWFGKIGTSEGDLKSSALVALGQSYRAHYNHLKFKLTNSILDSLLLIQEKTQYSILSWWYFRKARQTFAAELKDLEDIYIRNTDSLIEYPTFGEVLSGFSKSSLVRKISEQASSDNRPISQQYYAAYLGESQLKSGNFQKGYETLSKVLQTTRPKFDDLLTVHLIATILEHLDYKNPSYAPLSERLYTLSKPSIRNYGVYLTVNSSITDSNLKRSLLNAGFIVANDPNRLFNLESENTDDGIALIFNSPQTLGGKIKVHGPTIEEVINKLSDTLFAEEVL